MRKLDISLKNISFQIEMLFTTALLKCYIPSADPGPFLAAAPEIKVIVKLNKIEIRSNVMLISGYVLSD